MTAIPCAVLGTGNIGSDLMYKLLRSDVLELRAMVGIDPDSDGLARARAAGIATSDQGVDWILEHAAEVPVVFEATSARIHQAHAPRLEAAGVAAIDLTPAAVGPVVVPAVNGGEHVDAPNVNLITCGGQATVPIVAAVSRVARVAYAEIVSTISSRSAGPGTRQNIDEFTQRTARALEDVGGAERGKAIMVLNPAEPPILMRNTVYGAIAGEYDPAIVIASIEEMVADVSTYVPGYRLTSPPIVEEGPIDLLGSTVSGRVTVLLEVEGAGDYLPTYAGNLDVMTAAAVRVGEQIAGRMRAR